MQSLHKTIYQAVNPLLQGYSDNTPSPTQAYNHSLMLVYHLLMLCYAEAHHLLPQSDTTLSDLTTNINRNLRQQQGYSKQQTKIWCHIRHFLHHMCNTTTVDHSLVPIPAISDHYLAQAVDVLAYQRDEWDNPGTIPIAYTSIDLWELGNIHEHMLTMHPTIAQQPTAIYWNEKHETISIIPIESMPTQSPLSHSLLFRCNTGQHYLAPGSTKRKTTGSYYTPASIVNHLVEHTLSPLIAHAAQRVAQYYDERISNENIPQEAYHANLLAPYLAISILDPAMGSAYFLLVASDYLAQAMLQDPYIPPPPQESNPTTYYRTLIVQHCLYGVDRNLVTVELARMILWIYTHGTIPWFTLTQRLRCGNSLIGHWFDAPHTNESNTSYCYNPAIDPERLWAIANAWTARNFTTSMHPQAVQQLQEITQRMGESELTAEQHFQIAYVWNDLSQQPWFIEAQHIAQEKQFFHWQLAFPERFFDTTGEAFPQTQRGFHVVIGNPPYISFGLRGSQALPKTEQAYFRAAFPQTAQYKISLYALFIEQALFLTKSQGYHGYIIPDSFLVGKYFSYLRNLLLTTTHIQHIMLIQKDFWMSGSVGLPVIYIVQKNHQYTASHHIHIHLAPSLAAFQNENTQTGIIPQAFFIQASQQRFRLISSQHIRTYLAHIEKQSIPLSHVVKFYSGLIGKQGKHSIQLAYPTEQSCAKLIASTRHFDRYWLCYDGWYCPQDPTLYKSGYTPTIYQNPKLLLNQTGDRLRCCYDEHGYYCLNNMHVGSLKHLSYSLLYINALLCSRMFDFYYNATTNERGRANAQIDIDIMHSLPIPPISFTTPPAQREAQTITAQHLYEKATMEFLASLDMALPNHETYSTLRNYIHNLLTATPPHTDVVHDILASLAQHIITLNQSVQQKISTFLLWFEEKTGVSCNNGKAKTHLYRVARNMANIRVTLDESTFPSLLSKDSALILPISLISSPNKPFQATDIIKIVQTIAPKCKQTLHKNALGQNIIEQYQCHHSQIAPLIHRIVATDYTIETIIYQLYNTLNS